MEFLRLLEGIRTPFWDGFFSVITELGGETAFIVAAIVIYWCLDKTYGYYMMSVGFTGTVLNQFLKLICRVPRPWVRDPSFTIVESAREAATGYSFPSGHTQNAVTIFGTTARYVKKTGVRIGAVVILLLIAFSRMYLGVHTPADVLVSLGIAGVLTFALYPLLKKAEQKPKLYVWIFGGMLAVAAAFVGYLECIVDPAGLDAANYASACKNAYNLLGAVAGICAAFPVERRWVRFEPRNARWWGQILKVVLGMALVLGIKEVLRAPLLALTGGHLTAHAIRYFLIVFFAAAVWPMAFRWVKKN